MCQSAPSFDGFLAGWNRRSAEKVLDFNLVRDSPRTARCGEKDGKMKHSLETLDVAQRHSMVHSALHSMIEIRTGRRIPVTLELELGFPLYKNCLREDLIKYCRQLEEIDPFFDFETDLLSNAADSGNDELIKVCETYLNSASSTNFALSGHCQDFNRRLDVYASRHEKGSEIDFDGLDSVMDSLNVLSRVFSKVIEGCNKTCSAETASSFGKNPEFLNRCLVETMESFSAAASELFIIEDALHSQDAEIKQLALCRLGARRGVGPVWSEDQLHGGAARDVDMPDTPS